jgi:hypothetical protein
MALVQISGSLSPEQRYFCITHSDRPASLDRCDLNYLELRYSRPDRLPPTEPFESLKAAHYSSVYGGDITVYSLGANGRDRPRRVARLRPETYKPQHSIWHNGRLWVLGTEHVEVYDHQLLNIAHIEDPWLAGGHTILPDGNGHLLVSCSASDSVLVIDERSLTVQRALRLPEELYGRNYPLARTDSVVEHYITNDLQITHVNCASPWRGGILTSSLIPGAIGWFDPQDRYSELVRGYVGCHGVRESSAGEIYFCDSCLGTVVFLDTDLRIRNRIRTESFWLHDAVEVAPGLFALALFDKDEVRFIDANTRKVVHRIDCTGSGGPQFLAW